MYTDIAIVVALSLLLLLLQKIAFCDVQIRTKVKGVCHKRSEVMHNNKDNYKLIA